MVMDSTRAAAQWDWRPEMPLESILDEIARHAAEHPEWMEITT
jgi:CDP-paratose 2-epimerase